jgi:hypothetical protein
MGVMYSVFPLRGDMREWLQGEVGVALPGEDGRNPLASELLQVLRSLEGFETEESGFILGSPWTCLVKHMEDPERGGWLCANILNLEGGENEFYFEKGSPELILEVLARLAFTVGPLVLMTDSGDEPLVVRPGDSAKDLFATWGL